MLNLSFLAQTQPQDDPYRDSVIRQSSLSRTETMSDANNENLFRRIATSLDILKFNGDGQESGQFVSHFLPRKFDTFEHFCYAVFNDSQLEDFIALVILAGNEDATVKAEKRRNIEAANIHILHAREIIILEK